MDRGWRTEGSAKGSSVGAVIGGWVRTDTLLHKDGLLIPSMWSYSRKARSKDFNISLSLFVRQVGFLSIFK